MSGLLKTRPFSLILSRQSKSSAPLPGTPPRAVRFQLAYSLYRHNQPNTASSLHSHLSGSSSSPRYNPVHTASLPFSGGCSQAAMTVSTAHAKWILDDQAVNLPSERAFSSSLSASNPTGAISSSSMRFKPLSATFIASLLVAKQPFASGFLAST